MSPGFEWMELPAGQLTAHETLDSVLFPVHGLISFVLGSNKGTTSEVAMAGSESLVGLRSFLNSARPLIPAMVQRPVVAVRLPSRIAVEEFRRGEQFQVNVLSYVRIFLKQVAQTSLCNAQHTLQQRFCRWLLLSQDRLAPGECVAMSQEVIAGMLGVRREAVTRVARQLKARGLIDYTTRRIEIVDRQGLRDASCECYEALRRQYDELVSMNDEFH